MRAMSTYLCFCVVYASPPPLSGSCEICLVLFTVVIISASIVFGTFVNAK